MEKDLQGKTALVTGGGRGIGARIAERLAAAGAIVAVNYAGNAEAANATVAGIVAAGGQAFTAQAKLGEPGEIEKLVAILQDPKKFNIPVWLVNRRRDKFDGKSSQLVSNQIASKLRDDLEHLKKVRAHRGLRHYWGLKVRGQHTGTTGRGRLAATLQAAQQAGGKQAKEQK